MQARAPLVAGVVLAVPVLFLLLGAFLLRATESLGQAWLRFGLNLSVLFASCALAVVLLYRYGLERALTEDTSGVLVAAPFAGLALWLIGGRLLRLLPVLPLFRQVLWASLLTITLFGLLLLATQIQAPAAYFGASLAVLWLGLRAAVTLRQRKRGLRA